MDENQTKENSEKEIEAKNGEDISGLAKNTVDDIMNFAMNEMEENKKKENIENIEELSKNTVDDILNFASNEVKESKKKKKKSKKQKTKFR